MFSFVILTSMAMTFLSGHNNIRDGDLFAHSIFVAASPAGDSTSVDNSGDFSTAAEAIHCDDLSRAACQLSPGCEWRELVVSGTTFAAPSATSGELTTGATTNRGTPATSATTTMSTVPPTTTVRAATPVRTAPPPPPEEPDPPRKTPLPVATKAPVPTVRAPTPYRPPRTGASAVRKRESVEGCARAVRADPDSDVVLATSPARSDSTVGIVVGVLCALVVWALSIVAVVYIVKHRKQQQPAAAPPAPEQASVNAATEGMYHSFPSMTMTMTAVQPPASEIDMPRESRLTSAPDDDVYDGSTLKQAKSEYKGLTLQPGKPEYEGLTLKEAKPAYEGLTLKGMPARYDELEMNPAGTVAFYQTGEL